MIDGEHYLPVIKEALEKIEQEIAGELVAAVFVGGTEKIAEKDGLSVLGLPVIADDDPLTGLQEAARRFQPDLVVDLSDEPVVGYYERFRFASWLLAAGIAYQGADFSFVPPVFEKVALKPSLSIIGTGKRVGKTAVSAYLARLLKAKGFSPAVVAMGRGGPEEPVVLEGEAVKLTPDYLLAASRAGEHAASDYYEDALVSEVTTVGCRRCGGGLAGAVYVSNVLSGAAKANALDEKVLIFEGSGAALPPIKTDACVLIIGAGQPVDYIRHYFGPYRVLLADLAVLTMCEEPVADLEQVAALKAAVNEIKPELKVIPTVFRPRPLEPIEGEKVYVVMTVRPEMKEKLGRYLEEKFCCQVVGFSGHLANRRLLHQDLAANEGRFTLLLTELKAAAVDVVTELATARDLKLVYLDNVPVQLEGDLDTELVALAERAIERFSRSG